MGSLKVCIKVLNVALKYKPLLFKESRILLELCHFSLPWIYGFCADSSHTAIIMSFHAFSEAEMSLNIHEALKKTSHAQKQICNDNWKQVLLGCVAALEYLQTKKVLHNDIKCDNVLLERMLLDYCTIRAVIVDFNKACLAEEAHCINCQVMK